MGFFSLMKGWLQEDLTYQAMPGESNAEMSRQVVGCH